MISNLSILCQFLISLEHPRGKLNSSKSQTGDLCNPLTCTTKHLYSNDCSSLIQQDSKLNFLDCIINLWASSKNSVLDCPSVFEAPSEQILSLPWTWDCTRDKCKFWISFLSGWVSTEFSFYLTVSMLRKCGMHTYLAIIWHHGMIWFVCTFVSSVCVSKCFDKLGCSKLEQSSDQWFSPLSSIAKCSNPPLNICLHNVQSSSKEPYALIYNTQWLEFPCYQQRKRQIWKRYTFIHILAWGHF